MAGAERDPDPARRRFLRQGASAGLPLLLPCAAVAPLVACADSPASARERGAVLASVRDWGARGDGQADDTAAFQRAIDSLPANGGTVRVPPGRYLIDPTRKVRLRDHMHLAMDPEATLVTIPNGQPRAYVLLVEQVGDVEISGGRIVGDRHRHHNRRGEWGHAISVRGGQRVTIRNLHISDCWGDGISIGGHRLSDDKVLHSEDVVVADVVSTGNRRQGLTIGRSRNIRVRDSEFSHTAGTLPACGIDIEPDEGGTASDVLVERCRLLANEGNGIQIYRRSSDVIVRGCTIADNDGYGVLAIGTTGGAIMDNDIRGNALKAIALHGNTRGYELAGNRLRDNARGGRDGGKRGDGGGRDAKGGEEEAGRG